MRRLAIELFSVASRLLNVILGGTADMTFSARVHMDGWHRTERLIDALFFWEENHCAIWYRYDVQRAKDLLAYTEAKAWT